MIKVNLLGEKVDNAASHLLQVVGFGAFVVVVVGGCFLAQNQMSLMLAQAEEEKTTLTSELVQLKKVTKRVEGLEENKKRLQEKLLTIATLKAKKHGPVHVVDDLNNALPDRAWLIEIKENSGVLQLSGIALDHSTVAEFMRSLDESKYFNNVNLIHSTQHLVDEVKMKEFLIHAQLVAPLGNVKAVNVDTLETAVQEGRKRKNKRRKA